MKCNFCKKKSITLDCKWCKNNYCSRCILLEIHNCEYITNCKLESIKNLENKLQKEKTIDIKINKI